MGAYDLSREQTATEVSKNEATRRLCLLIVSDGTVATHALPELGRVVIGRAPDSAITIATADLSRHHLAIDVDQSGVWLQDLASTNGTRIRDKRVDAGRRIKLEVGDAIELGGAIAFMQYLPSPSAKQRVRAVALDAVPAGPLVIDPVMVALFRVIDRLAVGSLPVLVLGETGVGKEVIAEQLHARSPRTSQPLVRLNCAAFGEQLLESELFGHVRGAFTGATEHKEGLLVSADGGTVFLDEVGELPLVLQAKLLRVLENSEVLPVGAVRPIHVDVRFIAATNRDLAQAIERGTFRADLYHRLDGATLVVPPLRERRAEIVPLAERFLRRAARKHGLGSPMLTETAQAWLAEQPWLGNVRELRNSIERAVLLAESSSIGVEQFTCTRRELTPSPVIDDDPIRLRTLAVLAACNGNQTRAARDLGIARSTLVKRLDAYGTPRPQKA
jgi:two-component system, NtrC family, response regulator AtoC